MADSDQSVKHHHQANQLMETWKTQGAEKSVWLRFTSDWKNHPTHKIIEGMIAQWPIRQAALYVTCGRAVKVEKPKAVERKPSGKPDVEVKFLDGIASSEFSYVAGRTYTVSHEQAVKWIDRGKAVPVKTDPERAVAGPAEKRGKRSA